MGFFEFGDGAGGKTHADGNAARSRHGETGGRDLAHGTAQIDAARLQGNQTRVGIDLQVGTADDVAILQQCIGHALQAVHQRALDLVEFSGLLAIAGTE